MPLPPAAESEILAALAIGELRLITQSVDPSAPPDVVEVEANALCYNEFEVLAVLRGDDACFDQLVKLELLHGGNNWLRGPTWPKLLNALL